MKPLIYIVSFVALALATAWLGHRALERDLTVAELSLAALVVTGLVARWLLVARRRQRQKVEEMRDSALW